MADTFTSLFNLTKPEIGGDNNTWGDLLNENADAVDKILRDIGGDLVTGGSANAYTITPNWDGVSAEADGLAYRVRIHAAATTTTPTFNAIVCKKMVAGVAKALVAGDLPLDHWASLIYSEDETCWILENPAVENVLNWRDWVDVASASSVDVAAVGSPFVNITGTATIAGFATARAGMVVIVKLNDGLTLTNSATFILGGDDIVAGADSTGMFKSEGGGTWRLLGSIGGSGGSTASAAEIWAGTSTKNISVAGMQAAMAEVTLTDAATVTVNFGAGINFKLDTIAGNRTLALTVPAGAVGRSGYIRVKQDATGSRTLDLTDAKIANVNAQTLVLSTAANAVDLIYYTIISTTSVLMSMARAIA